MSTLTPLHGMAPTVVAQPSLAIVLTLAGLTSVGILALAVVALTRRQSWSYLLVTLAIGTLGLRVLLGGLMLFGLIDLGIHHLLEHVVDILMALLLFAAVYTARSTEVHASQEQYE
jgi:heme A synthase